MTECRLDLLPEDIQVYIHLIVHKMKFKNILEEFQKKVYNSKYYHVLQKYRLNIYKGKEVISQIVSNIDFIDCFLSCPSKFKTLI